MWTISLPQEPHIPRADPYTTAEYIRTRVKIIRANNGNMFEKHEKKVLDKIARMADSLPAFCNFLLNLFV